MKVSLQKRAPPRLRGSLFFAVLLSFFYVTRAAAAPALHILHKAVESLETQRFLNYVHPSGQNLLVLFVHFF